ncbi:MAG: hypothetical protein P1U68_18490 [Verrucomicrobiales bacterium]|nr:hypothetical protein [Verrucomicrobiales bacterium]
MEEPQEFESLTRRRILSVGGLAFLTSLFSGGEAEGMSRISSTIRSLKKQKARAKKIKNPARRRKKLREINRKLRMYQSL